MLVYNTKIGNEIFWIGNDPPFWKFSENSYIFVSIIVSKGGLAAGIQQERGRCCAGDEERVWDISTTGFFSVYVWDISAINIYCRISQQQVPFTGTLTWLNHALLPVHIKPLFWFSVSLVWHNIRYSIINTTHITHPSYATNKGLTELPPDVFAIYHCDFLILVCHISWFDILNFCSKRTFFNAFLMIVVDATDNVGVNFPYWNKKIEKSCPWKITIIVFMLMPLPGRKQWKHWTRRGGCIPETSSGDFFSFLVRWISLPPFLVR